MRKIVVIASFVAGSLMGHASPAAAHWVDWIRELHGPGPSWAISENYRFACVIRTSDILAAAGTAGPGVTAPTLDADSFQTSWFHPFEPAAGLRPARSPTVADVRAAVDGNDLDAAARLLCLADHRVKGYATLAVRFVQSFDNNLFPEDPTNALNRVRVLDVTASYFARLHSSVDAGVGAGVSRFSGKVFNPFHRVLLDVASVRFYPLALAGDAHKHHAISMGVAAQLYMPGFDGADFCDRGPCEGQREYRSAPHFQWRVGVGIHLPALINLIRD